MTDRHDREQIVLTPGRNMERDTGDKVVLGAEEQDTEMARHPSMKVTLDGGQN